MKLYHFALIFVCFAIAMVAITDLSVSEKNYMAEGTEVQNTIFDRAVVAATTRLLDTEEGASELKREEAVTAFYDSLFASFGISDMPASRENMKLYVPVICVTEPDGFYIYSDEVVYSPSGTGTEVFRCWTEKRTYNFREETAPSGYRATDFIIRFMGKGYCYVFDTQGIIHGKKGELFRIYLDDFVQEYSAYTPTAVPSAEAEYTDIVTVLKGPKNYWSLLSHPEEFRDTEANVRAEQLEEALNYYCNEHNYVAQQQGILYTFSIPSFDAETYLRATEGTSFLAFFQGYPVPGTSGETFNRYSVSNAQVEMVQAYYIDDTLTYHSREDCPLATEIIDSAGSQYGAAAKGAYACDRCYPDTGAHRHPTK